MARSSVRLNNRGVEDLLKSAPVDAATKRAAEAVAANVREMEIRVGDKDGGPREYDLPVTVQLVTTDRAHAIVALAHPAGEAVQAKHGALTKAAARAGLDVKGK
jgi:hypothetical protein